MYGDIMKLNLKSNKPLLIIISAAAGAAVILILLAYLFINRIFARINIVNSAEHNLQEGVEAGLADDNIYSFAGDEYEENSPLPDEDEELLSEDELAKLPEATEEEIAELERQLRNTEISDIKYDRNVYNILLIGSDSRKGGARGRSDSMILISINKKAKTITTTSILRDIYLKIPGRETGNRINAAFAYGGADLLLDTIRQNFRIRVDKYVIIDFYAFIDMVDSVGGITVEVSEEDIPVINGYVRELNKLTGQDEELDCLTEAGKLLLNGKQALGYARNRYVGSDFARTARQRKVLEQLFEKVKQLKLTAIKDLADKVLPKITTNLKEGELLSLILSLPSYIKYDIKQVTIPAAGSYKDVKIRGMAVLAIDFEKNIKLLHESIYGE